MGYIIGAYAYYIPVTRLSVRCPWTRARRNLTKQCLFRPLAFPEPGPSNLHRGSRPNLRPILLRPDRRILDFTLNLVRNITRKPESPLSTPTRHTYRPSLHHCAHLTRSSILPLTHRAPSSEVHPSNTSKPLSMPAGYLTEAPYNAPMPAHTLQPTTENT